MPNYISHAIMAEKTTFDSKIELDKNVLRAYSIAPDLMISYKNGVNITHNQKTQSFFLSLISDIKNNKLYNDQYIMSYLYGQILHYALDTTVHPYVYYMTNDIPKLGLVNFHMAFEEYLGYYLLNQKLNTSRENLRKDFYTDFKWQESIKLQKTIDKVYSLVYSIEDASKYQIKTGKLLKTLDIATRVFQKNNGEVYLKIIGLDKYLEFANLNQEDLTNENHEVWYNPITNQQADDSLLELFDQAIVRANEIIEEVNKVIYNDERNLNLIYIFDNKSYDTGLDCRIGKPYIRSRMKDSTLLN